MNRAHSVTDAYVPFFAQLVRALHGLCRPGEVDDLMRAVGRRLAAEGRFDQRDFAERVEGAAALLEDLGGPCTVRALEGGFIVSGNGGCTLAEAVQGGPEGCRALESVMAELVQFPVRERCRRGHDGPRCWFEIRRLAMQDARANPFTNPSTE